ncbi:MAG: sensor domain-containing diguanylate cyclase [Vicinamibacterales bacterium]
MDRTLLRIVADLEQLTTDLTSHEIAQAGVDIAQRATASHLAYLHFLNDDQDTIELGAWSHETLDTCTSFYDRHYPIADAGLWADSVRTRRPCVHNDYSHEADRRGLPDGHAPLVRHLGLPVIDEGRVRLLLGVGNKATDYGDVDVELLQIVGQRIWTVMKQRRVLEHYLDMAARLRQMQQLTSVCGVEYDIDDDALECDSMFASVFGVDREVSAPRRLAELLAFVADADRDVVERAFTAAEPDLHVWRMQCSRGDGTTFSAELALEFRAREIGEGLVANGTVRDLTEEQAIESLRRRADTDPLTGLPNRNVLTRLLESEEDRRKQVRGVAFHYIDLDGFKLVNDTHGHIFGDEVLRIVADRLRRSTRQGDIVLRMGGDEFAVVQMGVDGPASALLLADAIVEAISEPIVAHGRTVGVGASVGIALSVDGTARLRDLSAKADHALYRAKALGGRRSMISGAWE